jgi:hypothetical protein
MDELDGVALRRINVLLPSTERTPERRGLVSAMGDHAGAYFVVSPFGRGMGMRDGAFRTYFCMRIGMEPILLWKSVPHDAVFQCPQFRSCNRMCRWDDGHRATCTGINKIQQHNLVQNAAAACAAEIRRNTAIRIDVHPAVADYFVRKPGTNAHLEADLLIVVIDHVMKVIDFVTVHPQHLHTLASTKNGVPAIAAEKYKWDKYRSSVILDNKLDRKFAAFAIETYGTLGQPARELIEWLGRSGFPLTEVGEKSRTLMDSLALLFRALTRAFWWLTRWATHRG